MSPFSTESTAIPSFFPASSQVAILGGHFIQNNTRGLNDRHAEDHLTTLYKEVAPNAILNSGGRLDPVRCYPGTRKEVIERIDRWQGSGYRADRRILWLSGPAGAGKSAIFQTVAELWIGREIPLASFFFFRADSSRNHARAIVATLLYQILDLYPDLKDHVNSILEKDLVILRQSIQIQFKKLIQEPIDLIRRRLPPFQPPIILLIDGLDECDSGAQEREDQKAFLHLLNGVVTAQDSPFIALVASRPEPHLIMAFNEIGTFHRSIFLDASYRPDADIKRFTAAELASIKRVHHLGHFLTKDWPSQAIIASIVEKSSGQFVYATTVMRFIRNSPASPAMSMDIVLGLRPVKSISPFAELDVIYSHILNQARDWDVVRDVLAIYRMLKSPHRQHLSDVLCSMPDLIPEHVLSALGYSSDDLQSSLSDLTSLVRLDSYSSGYYSSLHYHHASLEDFLYNQTRAGKLYIDLNSVACRTAARLWDRNPDVSNVLGLLVYFLDYVTEPDIILNDTLQNIKSLYYSKRRSALCTWQLAPLAWHFLDRVEELLGGNLNSVVGS